MAGFDFNLYKITKIEHVCAGGFFSLPGSSFTSIDDPSMEKVPVLMKEFTGWYRGLKRLK
jgi:hypothetical protein